MPKLETTTQQGLEPSQTSKTSPKADTRAWATAPNYTSVPQTVKCQGCNKSLDTNHTVFRTNFSLQIKHQLHINIPELCTTQTRPPSPSLRRHGQVVDALLIINYLKEYRDSLHVNTANILIAHAHGPLTQALELITNTGPGGLVPSCTDQDTTHPQTLNSI